MVSAPTGYDLLHDAELNKSTAFSREERDALGLRGLLPHRINDAETQQVRVLENLHRKAYDIERYIFLISLLERNQTLFFRTLIDNIEELMPLIYTPTVGQALYVACAGIHPSQCLPVMLDVGTNNEELLADPLYLGYPEKRISGEQYDGLVEEFVAAVFDRYPNALLQFEDFLTPNAYRLLDTCTGGCWC